MARVTNRRKVLGAAGKFKDKRKIENGGGGETRRVLVIWFCKTYCTEDVENRIKGIIVC
jgi:hypothetical protein